MKIARFLLCLLALGALSNSFARDMDVGTEAYYVVQGLFTDLGLETVPCNINDQTIQFACGFTTENALSIQANIDAHVEANLPGLNPIRAWFSNGSALVTEYRSVLGQYYIAYLQEGYIMVAFTSYQQ